MRTTINIGGKEIPLEGNEHLLKESISITTYQKMTFSEIYEKFGIMIPGLKVFSPELKWMFTVKEIKGNAIYTEEGAVLSKKLIKS